LFWRKIVSVEDKKIGFLGEGGGRVLFSYLSAVRTIEKLGQPQGIAPTIHR